MLDRQIEADDAVIDTVVEVDGLFGREGTDHSSR
jgi:hypothetical protein